MNDQNRFQAQAIPAGNTMDMSVDAGLRSFMLGVYNKMGLGLVLSGILAYITSSVPPVRDLLFTANGGYTGAGMILSCQFPVNYFAVSEVEQFFDDFEEEFRGERPGRSI